MNSLEKKRRLALHLHLHIHSQHIVESMFALFDYVSPSAPGTGKDVNKGGQIGASAERGPGLAFALSRCLKVVR